VFPLLSSHPYNVGKMGSGEIGILAQNTLSAGVSDCSAELTDVAIDKRYRWRTL